MVRNSKGITLIALVITIIVLLILSGISLSLMLGNEGILKKAVTASDRTNQEGLKEELQLKLTGLKMGEYSENKKYAILEIIEQLEDEGYSCIDNNEEEIIVEKDGYEFTVRDFIVQEEVRKAGSVPEILEQPTFQYNITEEVGLDIKIVYPYYAKTKQYKIGEDGEWKKYSGNLKLSEESVTVYAKYVTRDGKNSEEVSKKISKILKYTNASKYMRGTSDSEKIGNIMNLFNKSYYEKIGDGLNVPWFYEWCSNEVYFQDNKTEPIRASRVRIVSYTNSAGNEPIKEFYITASNTVDFSDEVELYRGIHSLENVTSGKVVSDHQFEAKGNYQFYRLYVVSWWPFNEGDAQHVWGCYIE